MVDKISTFTTIFLSIFVNAVPFLLLGTLASGLVEVFLDRDDLARLAPKHPLSGAFVGGLLGLFIPVCACGVVPLARRLFMKGAPLSLGISFLLAAPGINPITIASTVVAFGPGLVSWGRIGLTLLIAVATGALFSLQPDRQRLLLPDVLKPAFSPILPVMPVQEPADLRSSTAQTWRDKARRAIAIASDEFFELNRYLVIGALLAALIQTLVPRTGFVDIGRGPVLSAVVMVILAVFFSVYPTVDSFTALVFTGSFSGGSILAFLVYGSMIDVKSMVMLTRLFHKRIILYLALVPLLAAVIAAILMNITVR